MLLLSGHLSDAGTKSSSEAPFLTRPQSWVLGCEFLGDHWSTIPVPQPLSTKAIPSSLTMQAAL